PARAEHDPLRRVGHVGRSLVVRVDELVHVDQVGRLGGGAGARGHASILPLTSLRCTATSAPRAPSPGSLSRRCPRRRAPSGAASTTWARRSTTSCPAAAPRR